MADTLQLEISKRRPSFSYSGFVKRRSRNDVVPATSTVTLNNRLVTSNGFIVDHITCTAQRNGGCATHAASWISTQNTPVRYARVVTIAAEWAFAVWHFPMEALVALAYVNRSVLDTAVLHVSRRTPYVQQWCDLVGIDWNRVIDGTVLADELIVPRMGGCGAPGPIHLEWLKARIADALRSSGMEQSFDWTVIVIKRTKSSRQMKNVGVVENVTGAFSDSIGLPMTIHDDIDLPPLLDQLRMFTRAVVIVAPHGAGELLMIASPPGACVVEMIDPNKLNMCFTELAYRLGHHYYALAMYNGVVSAVELETALDFCRSKLRHPLSE